MSQQVLPPRAYASTTSGWLVVSPDLQWILHDYGIVTTRQNGKHDTFIGHVDYQPGPSGILQPVHSSRHEYEGQYDMDPKQANLAVAPISWDEFHFTKLEFGDMPARDFTLTAYGLPEFGQSSAKQATKAPVTATEKAAVTQTDGPPISRRSTPPIAWWIFGLAAVALGVAIVARRLGSNSGASGSA